VQIYMIDEDPYEAARDLFDVHLNSTILEAAQMLSTVCWMVDCCEAESLYAAGRLWAPTQEHSPCTKWAAGAQGNWTWLRRFAFAAEAERRRRFPHRKQHAGITMLLKAPHCPPIHIPILPYRTPFKGNLPERYSGVEVTHAYRWYLFEEKGHLAKWTGREPPEWWVVC
jgi:hypothetical protein